MNRAVAASAVALSLIFAATAAAQTLPPRDECAADRSFVIFRAELLDVLARRDSARLLEIAAEDIQFSFGDDPGRDNFSRSWGLADPLTSGLWTALGEALLLGCARDGDSLAAPFLYGHWPEQFDLFEGAVAPPGTLLYRSASIEADFEPLAWHVVAQLEEQPTGWRRARLADGRTGHIEPGAVLMSPIGYRAIFEKRAGQWRMTAFIAGD